MASRCFRFSGHQTFAFRYGWPEKGYDFVIHGNHFSDPDAMITLGVGKNMVESIKYWCEMLGIISEYGKVTAFAQKLLDRENGWDPYLEDNASLWLLHWRFCTQTQWMSAATFLFGETFKNAISYKEFNNLLEKKLSSIGDSQNSPCRRVFFLHPYQ